MSERTTIGGTTYESVGSSSSNLLLKCNGTARIQWGNKLIDLVKNGKIASGDSSINISLVSDESEIKAEGIYVVEKENNTQLWIKTKGKQINLTGKDLYISASTKQDITAEQKELAMSNIGMCYNTLEEVKSSGIQNGLVYVLDTRTLYTIKEGNILEFEAKVKTVTVEEEHKEGEAITNLVRIVLSVANQDYLTLEDNIIKVSQDLYISNNNKIQSELASDTKGYRLYMNQGKSYLEVDYIKVRYPEETFDYIEVTYDELNRLISQKKLKEHKYYKISDYFNPWRFPKYDRYTRPILVQALTNATLYSEGCLFDNRRVSIKYDLNYKVSLKSDSDSVVTPGLITWMKDESNNEANFDFLDYLDSDNQPLTTLHSNDNSELSIFPRGSYNNKITVKKLKGLVIEDGVIDYDNSYTIDFKFQDWVDEGVLEEAPTMAMYGNNITCCGLVTSEDCSQFYNNTITNSGVLVFNSNCYNNTLSNVYNNSTNTISDDVVSMSLVDTIFTKEVNNVTIKTCANSHISGSLIRSTFDFILLSQINGDVSNSSFKDVSNCIINATCNKVTFNTLNSCMIDVGTLENLTCRSDLASMSIDSTTYPLIYDTSRVKDVYFINGQFQIIDSANSGFPSGMIVMHSGIGIPDGWAPCDGEKHWYQGQEYTTPNLVGRFIKAVGSYNDIGEGNVRNDGKSNEFTLEEYHLPAHTHPHEAHTHTISEITGTLGESGDLNLTSSTEYMTETSVTTVEAVTSVSDASEASTLTYQTSPVIDGIEDIKSIVGVSGGNHTHTLSLNSVSVGETTSTESNKTWSNQSFSIEPNYYSLIFIIKL
jgi:hypothetical protein